MVCSAISIAVLLLLVAVFSDNAGLSVEEMRDPALISQKPAQFIEMDFSTEPHG